MKTLIIICVILNLFVSVYCHHGHSHDEETDSVQLIFSKNSVVPDVIDVAPTNLLKV